MIFNPYWFVMTSMTPWMTAKWSWPLKSTLDPKDEFLDPENLQIGEQKVLGANI